MTQVVGNISVVDTQANLRALVGAANGVAILQGFSSLADGGGGLFLWTSDTQTPDDGGTVIAMSSGRTGAWKRIYSGGLNVKWFGAQGTGSGDDGTAIATALRAAWLLGSKVYVPAGTYPFNATLNLTEKTVMYGDGDGSNLLYTGSGIAILWQASGDAARGLLYRLQLSSQNNTGSTIGIKIVDGACVIRDVWVSGIGNMNIFTTCGVQLVPLTFNTSNTAIENCRIQQCSGDGIQISGGALSSFIRGSAVTGNGRYGINANGGFQSKSQFSVYACDLEGNGLGGITGSFFGSTISGCYYEPAAGSTNGFIDLSPGSNQTFGLVVQGNEVNLNGSQTNGMNFLSSSATFGLVCSGNHIRGLKGAAGTSACILAGGVVGGRFENNYSENGNLGPIVDGPVGGSLGSGNNPSGLAYGLDVRVYRFVLASVQASRSPAPIPLDSPLGQSSVTMENVGYILSVSAHYSGTITAGSYQVQVFRDATKQIDTGPTSQNPVVASSWVGISDPAGWPDNFATGTALSVQVGTSTDFEATGGNLLVEVEVGFGTPGA